MRSLILLFVVILSLNKAQSQAEAPYSWKYVMSYVKKNKSVPAGTHAIVDQISKNYKEVDQQNEIIRFYNEAYDFKIVDKALLKKLIDSLIVHGLNPEVKELALTSRNNIEYRILNKRITDFNYPDKNRTSIRLSSLNDKIVVVELWATWCGPCKKEMVKIPDLKQQYPQVEFYSISLDRNAELMKKFVEKNKYEWPIVFGGDEKANPELWQYLNIVAIPKYYVVNKEGVVIYVTDKLNEELIEHLQ